MATYYGRRLITDGLILALDAGNIKSYPGTGTTWFDLSGNERNLTVFGSPTFNSLGYFTFANNQTTQYMQRFPFDIPTSAITFSCWFRSSFTQANQTPFTYSVGGDNTFLLYTDSSTIIVPHDIGNRFAITVLDMANRWCNFVWTRVTSTGVSLYYMNGVYVGTQTIAAGVAPVAGGYLIIGQESDSAGGGFDPNQNLDGDFSRLEVYNRVLSGEEVMNNFNAVKGRYGY